MKIQRKVSKFVENWQENIKFDENLLKIDENSLKMDENSKEIDENVLKIDRKITNLITNCWKLTSK